MDNELYEEEQVPSGLLTGIHLSFLTEKDMKKMSVLSIDAATQVTDPQLGLPNPSDECSTCGAKEIKLCEGHFGDIKFPCTILHPYYLSEVVQILNKICPGCKSIRQRLIIKGAGRNKRKGCDYCGTSYPRMKFRVSSKDLFKRSAIIVEVSGSGTLPKGYWDFIPEDAQVQQDENCIKQNKRVLSHAQVHYLLNGVDPDFIQKVIGTNSPFMNSFLVTPNFHRVTEFVHAFSNGQKLMWDERTRAYKKLVDFKGVANELGSRVLDCLKLSKLNKENSSKDLISGQHNKIKDSPSKTSGLRWIKDVVLGKRSDHCFRMVVVGDPNIKLNEIGIPCEIAERLQISEHRNQWNFKKLDAYCNLRLMEKGVLHVHRKGSVVPIYRTKKLEMGDGIYRPLSDGDIILINRPPSIHQHSIVALSAKILPVESVVSINPLCCSPFRGDFDGDCLHGFVPQSVNARVELRELVALDKQLINGQSGGNLLSLSQDSLIAAHLIMEDGILLNLFQMQQLAVFCGHALPSPAIIKAPSLNSHAWTGKQLFSMLLPSGFDYSFASNGVYISNGELISSSDGSSWLRDASGNLFQSLVKHCNGQVLDFLNAAQEVLCEWLSMRGLSVSLSDLYLASDSCSRKNLMEEIFCSLQEAEKTCMFRQLMVDSCQKFLMGCSEENQSPVTFDAEQFCYEKQKSVVLSQAAVDAFKHVFRDIQSLAYKYAVKDNSLLAMFKAGSKGNLLKLVQQSMCLGLLHSLVPLSFRIPNQLSCAAWNNQKACGLIQEVEGTSECVESYIPCAVVESSFLTGLNPLECFVHSVTSRDSSFSNNAELPGTLTRKIMFFMRDLYTGYDGTVRNAYGNQLVQFSYNIDKDISTADSTTYNKYDKSSTACDAMAGQPVGSLSACAISEAAYSALDQPISLLETSPLLNLKNILECGSRKNSAKKTVSLFLSEKLGRRRFGFEYGALEVKNHLERLMLSDVVSAVMIIFSSQTGSRSPWVSHFHICKEIIKRRRLKVKSIIDSLNARCESARLELKIRPELKNMLCNLKITSKGCSAEEDNNRFCITVTMARDPKNSSEQLDQARDLVIPFLLRTVVKGFQEVQKVDILWNDRPKVSKVAHGSSGELYLRVSMSGNTGRAKLWNLLMNDCLQIMDMIDWSRSHPDNVHDLCTANGIDAGWKYFLNNLESAAIDIGKNILPEHLLLVANCLSSTGEFVGLNAKGLTQQKEHANVSSPFMQASFSTPGPCFIKAAKAGVVDDLQGSVEALSWGNTPSFGTGGQFELLFSWKAPEISEPLSVYDMLGSDISSNNQNVVETSNAWDHSSDKSGAQSLLNAESIGLKKLERLSKSKRKFLSYNDIVLLSQALSYILHNKYPINEMLNEADKKALEGVLNFHPQRDLKIGSGVQDIKVGNHPKYNERCFIVVRKDGSEEDFSYHKCIQGVLEIVAPERARWYRP